MFMLLKAGGALSTVTSTYFSSPTAFPKISVVSNCIDIWALFPKFIFSHVQTQLASLLQLVAFILEPPTCRIDSSALNPVTSSNIAVTILPLALPNALPPVVAAVDKDSTTGPFSSIDNNLLIVMLSLLPEVSEALITIFFKPPFSGFSSIDHLHVLTSFSTEVQDAFA